MNLADPLAHHARARPDHPAILAGDRAIPYRDLDGLVRRWAAHLSDLGLRGGEVVAIALRDTPDHLLALLAAARMGALAQPVDWRWTPAEQAAVTARFGARMLLTEPDVPKVAGVPNLRVDAAFHAAVAAAPADRPFLSGAACAGMPLFLSLSSGTTGRPKGPAITHEGFLRRLWTHWIDLGLNARETFLTATPLYFGGGRSFSLSLLFSGGTAILFPPPWKPEEFVEEVARRGATSAFLVPTQFRRLLDLPEDVTAPMRSMRLLLSSGAPLTPWERRAIRDRLCPNFHEYYASTEGGGISLLRPEEMDTHGDTVGRPVFGVEVAILDDDLRPLPSGEVGRLGYRGPGVATGFFRDPEADAEAFHDGWFLPGDLAEQDAAGYVTLRGRRKDMIIRGGVNIHPAEVEAVLLSDPSVAEAAVVGWPSAAMGEEVAAFVVPRGEMDAEALLAACRARLAPYKVPRAVIPVPDLPRNAGGKTIKAELVARLSPL